MKPSSCRTNIGGLKVSHATRSLLETPAMRQLIARFPTFWYEAKVGSQKWKSCLSECLAAIVAAMAYGEGGPIQGSNIVPDGVEDACWCG